MKKVIAEVIGPNPPCYRCIAVKKNVEAVAKKLRTEGIEVEVKRLDIMSREVLRKKVWLAPLPSTSSKRSCEDDGLDTGQGRC